MTSTTAVSATQLDGITLKVRGKVRDVYEVGGDLLFIATDRISAFDYILPTGIPDKGKVLNQISLFWFEKIKDLVPHHMISADVGAYPAALRPHASLLQGRSMLVRRLDMFPVECVVRGYLAGSGWKEYQKQGTVCGLPLPTGLQQAQKLAEPIFTPATKAETGHDENIPFATMVDKIGQVTAEKLRDLSLKIFARGAEHAASRGILLADTKFEFGVTNGQIVLGDEVLTPDSSRFWDARRHQVGTSPPSFDKQFVRDYLESIDWDKQPPVPSLPAEIVAGARQLYLEIFETLTGVALTI